MFREATFARLEVDKNSVISDGTYSPVYRGHLGEFINVAVKIIEIKRSTFNSSQEKALLRLEHPNVARLLHVDEQDDYR